MRKLSRQEKMAYGLGAVLVAIIIWLLLRKHPIGQGGDVTLGPVNIGDVILSPNWTASLPAAFNMVMNFEAPSPGALPGSTEAGPCACGCEGGNMLEFLDLSEFAAQLQHDLQASEMARINQFYYSMPDEFYFLTNDQRINEFENPRLGKTDSWDE